MAASDAESEDIAELKSEVRNTATMLAEVLSRLGAGMQARRAAGGAAASTASAVKPDENTIPEGDNSGPSTAPPGSGKAWGRSESWRCVAAQPRC